MMKRNLWLLSIVFSMGIMFGGCGKEKQVQAPVVDNMESETETEEIKIIDDNGGVIVNELLEEEKEPVSAEVMEEEKEPEPITASEADEETDDNTEAEETESQNSPVIDPITEAEIEEDDIVVDVSSLNGQQENMLMLMDALNICMTENGYTYDANNAEFFWKAINYTIMMYPEVPGSDLEELLGWADDYSCMNVHADLVDIYAEGLFASYTALPEVPEGHMVSAGDEAGYYKLSVGDRGDSYGEIVTWVETADGSCHVETKLIDAATGEAIASYVYELVENSDENAVFAYRIKDARIKE